MNKFYDVISLPVIHWFLDDTVLETCNKYIKTQSQKYAPCGTLHDYYDLCDKYHYKCQIGWNTYRGFFSPTDIKNMNIAYNKYKKISTHEHTVYEVLVNYSDFVIY